MKKIIFFYLLLLFFCNCSNNNEKKNFFKGEVKKIEFKNEFLITGERVNIDTIGIAGVDVYPPFLIVKNYRLPFFTQIYRESDSFYLGDYFHKGEGPKSFLDFQIIKKRYPYLWIKDSKKKQVSLINTKGFEDNSFEIEKVYSFSKAIDPFNVFFINDTCLLIKDFDVNKGLYYSKYNPQKEEKISNDYILYNYPITYPLMNKMLTLSDQVHPDGNKIVSITGIFDQIDIVNLKDSLLNISVTTSNDIIDYHAIKDKEDADLKEYYFSIPFCDENAIFILYRSQKSEQVEVHIIKWNGDPITKLLLNKNIRDITVDNSLNVLYGIEAETEYLYKFNLKECNLSQQVPLFIEE